MRNWTCYSSGKCPDCLNWVVSGRCPVCGPCDKVLTVGRICMDQCDECHRLEEESDADS